MPSHLDHSSPAKSHPHQPVIAILSANQGHASLAEAAAHHLAGHYRIVTFQQPIKASGAYTLIYRYVPWAFRTVYQLSTSKLIQSVARWFFYWDDAHKIQAFLRRHQPVACLTTYFSYLPILEEWQRQTGHPVFNVVANPRTTHPLEIAANPVNNLVFDEFQSNRACQLKPGSYLTELGWLTRPEFKPATNQKKLRTELNLDPQLLTITLIGGSEGSQTLSKITKHLIQTHQDRVQLVVVCGTNTLLLKELTNWRAELVTQLRAHVHLVGFTTQLEQYLQTADLVVGKAGPNSLFETTACEVPFVAMTHISGQEDGNLELIQEKQLGMVLEEWSELVAYLDSVVSDPSQLKGYASHLSSAAEYVRQSGARLKAVVDTALAGQDS